MTSPVPPLPAGLRSAGEPTPLGGGSVGRLWRTRLADGRDVVVKATPYEAELEAEGLRALGDAGAPVPEVLGVGSGVLVLEHVAGPPDWEALGRALAAVHDHIGPAFGWHRDNVIGPLPQDNGRLPSSGAFVVERRILPHLGSLPPELAGRLESACGGPLPELLDEHQPSPSLVHGDLWIGNVVAGRWLIDPAVHHADRETDLAMLTLFGGPDPAFWRGYETRSPLPAGWERRRHALQLPPLLVHVRLFGASYLPGVARALDGAALD